MSSDPDSLDDDFDEGRSDTDNTACLPPVLRLGDRTQRRLVGREINGRRKLSKTRLEEYSGAGTTKQSKDWKRSANFAGPLHGLTDQELAKHSVDILEVADLE